MSSTSFSQQDTLVITTNVFVDSISILTEELIVYGPSGDLILQESTVSLSLGINKEAGRLRLGIQTKKAPSFDEAFLLAH